jgi:hypothetical protein
MIEGASLFGSSAPKVANLLDWPFGLDFLS